jgi:DNA-binding NarL/FixJ family response regulator
MFTIAHLPNEFGDIVASTNPFKNGPSPQAIELTSRSVSPEAVMSIRLLLVDDSDIMRAAIRQLLIKELGIEVVGTATSFAEAIALTAALKPDVLLMDLHMPDERGYPPELVKSQILLHAKCIVVISLWNDSEAKALAGRFGAHVLLDKMKLYSELIPAINQYCPSVGIPRTAEALEEKFEPPFAPSIEATIV